MERRFPNRRTGPYVARLQLGKVGDRLELVELTLTSIDQNRIISSRLPGLRLSEFVAEALQDLALDVDPGELLNASDRDQAFHDKRAKAWAEYKLLVVGSATGRRYPAGHLARVADIYTEALRRHEHPTQAVAKVLQISPEAAAKQVARARQARLLPQTTKGKARGRRATRRRDA